MRTGIGCFSIIVGFVGFGYGLMKYTFTGFPFGGGEAVIAEGHAQAMQIMVPFTLIFIIGLALLWFSRRGDGKRTDDAKKTGGE